MPDAKQTIVDAWPFLKEDLLEFLSDTDGWVIARLKEARTAQDWGMVRKLVEVMEMVHGMSHGH